MKRLIVWNYIRIGNCLTEVSEMAKMTSAYANKVLKKLQEDKEF